MKENSSVVVIGSGPSGAMAAHKLVKKGIPVTLLESGTNPPEGMLVRLMGRNVFRRTSYRGFEDGARYVASGDPQTHWFQNLSPGGLSNQWTGAVPRFAPEDFFEGERLHEKYRWPITYEDLVPYYEEAERLMKITAAPHDVPHLPAQKSAYTHKLPADWQRIAGHASAHGQGLTTLPLADGSPWMMVSRGTAFNSFTNVIQPLLRHKHVRLIMGAHVLRLEYSSTKGQVDAVVYYDRQSGQEERLSAAAVVVACGPLNSTKLLFDSACTNFPDGLGNSEGVLGQYLHDHPREWWCADFEKPLSRLVPAGYLTRKPHTQSDPLLATSWSIGLSSSRDKVLSFTPMKTHSVGVQVFGTMVPSKKHFVKPAQNKNDEFGLPALDISIHYEDTVIDNMVSARHHFMGLMEDAGYSGKLREVVPQLKPGSSVHYGGTIRMHCSNAYGMLDGWNRLHDVNNVIVTDASCFTTGSEKNPTLTAMALSARAAEHLAGELKAG